MKNFYTASEPKIDPPQSIVIFRALQLGDLLCSVPAFRALRAAFPRARVTLVGLPWTRDFVKRFGAYLDDFLEFPGYPGLPERAPDLAAVPAFFAEAQRRRFDLALQLHGSGSFVNSITVLLGARQNAGYYLKGEFCPDPRLFMPYPALEHEIRQPLALLGFLGIPSQGEALEFPLDGNDEADFEALPESADLKRDFACVHAGSRLPSRRWAPERFAAAADALAAQGLGIALTGSAAETPLVEAVASRMRFPAVNLAGRTTLGALGVLVKRARLVVSNDTGISHIAAALKTPSVVVVTGSDPSRWAPLETALHQAVFRPIDCRPCYFFDCPIGHPCAEAVTPEMVLDAAEKVMPAAAAKGAS